MQPREVLPTLRQFLHPTESRRTKFGNVGQYERQICAFIDLLGVRGADKTDPHVREGLLDLFWSISAVSAPCTTNLLDENPIDSWWGPEISAFSDCFVVSYPIDRIEKLHQATEMPTCENILHQIRYIVGTFAAACLSQGFLLRGAITVGDLYHSDGVILGPALDEAYELERKDAVYPRILVSNAVLDLLPPQFSHPTLRLGTGGKVHIDYICDMILESAPTEYALPEYYEASNLKNDSPTSYYDGIRAWLSSAVDILNLQLEKQTNPRFRSKWIWFANEFQDALNYRMMRGIFEDYRMFEFTERLKVPPKPMLDELNDAG